MPVEKNNNTVAGRISGQGFGDVCDHPFQHRCGRA